MTRERGAPEAAAGGDGAHRTRLAARIKHRALEREGLDRPAGAADRDHLGMRGRVVRGGDLVPAFSEHLAVADDHGPERAAFASLHVLPRERHGAKEMAAIVRGKAHPEALRCTGIVALSAMRSRSAR